ncbi:unnamed protein product [Paramecium pentaurelia]|uniref:AN1-type domain-containing protein n=1 Tax=Paramecium pentaurelia TaxID=43138 RepID=A0A8S1RYM9_9CILI|nr:unnamed protein product [Paramecium pentaurelia]
MNLDDQMERCALEYCKRRDFLPFQCTLCNKKFCLEHKDLKDHECPFQFAEKKAVQCSKCNKVIQYLSTKSEEEVLKQHVCEQVKKEEQKCPQCKVRLNEVNKYECKQCHREVCLKHRMQEDHNCRRINQTGCCTLM